MYAEFWLYVYYIFLLKTHLKRENKLKHQLIGQHDILA